MARKRDFQNKKFNNPYFQKKNQSRPKRLKKFLVLALFSCLIFTFYLFNTYPLFKITEIEVSGNLYTPTDSIVEIASQQLLKKKLLIFRQDSLVFFNQNALSNDLVNSFNFESVKVKKSYFNTLKIIVAEKSSVLILGSNNQRFHIDKEGIAIRELIARSDLDTERASDLAVIRPEISPDEIPAVIDLSNSPVEVNQKTFERDKLNFIVDLFSELKKTADFGVSYFEIEKPHFSELTLYTQEGWKAIFRLANPPKTQARLLQMVLSQKVKDRKNLEYIDLRYGEKIYWQ